MNKRIIINCLICRKTREIYRSSLKYGRGKYCSKKCEFENPFIIKKSRRLGLSNKGRVLTTEHKSKIRKALIGRFVGNDNQGWKGDYAGYAAIHIWLRRNFGNATKCIKGHVAKKYYWANISGAYKRDLSDWHELCNSCNGKDGVRINQRFLIK